MTRIPRRVGAFAPVDNASLVFFRLVFGLLMMWEVWRYFQYGWIPRQWIEPQFFFTYHGFSWVKPWPGHGMYLHWGVLGLLALFITAGFLYRLSAFLFFLGFTYCFLLDQTTYLNHFYLVCLLSFLLIFLPANRAVSIDAWLRPKLRSQTTPAWTLWLLRFQMGVVYFFGGIAKISPDWLRGEPMRSWMARTTDFPVIGKFFRDEWAVYAVSYGGLFLDLLIVPLLLWRRTRIFALVLAIAFHLVNAQMFQIGIFPWLGIAATLLFLRPDWPRRLLRFGRRASSLSRRPGFQPGQLAGLEARPPDQAGSLISATIPKNSTLVLNLLAIYIVIQLLVPLRHLLYPGRADWTYEGHRFSWRMKLHDRNARARFNVVDQNSNQSAEISPRAYLTRIQASKMAARPDMILQFAHFLVKKIPSRGPKPYRVEARVLASLNGRKPQLFIDQNVDLAAERRTLWHVPWVLPLTEPLPAARAESESKAEVQRDETPGE